MVAGMTAFAFTTKFDVTEYGQYLRAGVLGLFAMGVLGLFFSFPFLHLIYAYVGALVFAGYLVYDTQLIMGGKHQHCRFGVDDYAFAALSVYLDIIRLFLFMLRIAGTKRNSRR